MSKYEDYTRVSTSYDSARQAAWAEMYEGYMKVKLTPDLSSVHMLDAGCGTGNYARAMLDCGVGKVTLLDANAGMLEQARQKVEGEYADRVEFVQHHLPTLPFPDHAFDAVMINQVLHHLDDSRTTGGDEENHEADSINGCVETGSSTFITNGKKPESGSDPCYSHPKMAKAILEAGRVLRPGGVFILHTYLPSHGIGPGGPWYYRLVPAAGKRCAALVPALPELKRYIAAAGCFRDSPPQVFEPIGSEWNANTHNYEGPLDATWRNLDSFWSLVTEEELREMEGRLRGLRKRGELRAYYEQLVRDKGDTGDMTLVFMRKDRKNEDSPGQ